MAHVVGTTSTSDAAAARIAGRGREAPGAPHGVGTFNPGAAPESAMGGRPLDVLEASLDDPVVVRLKDGRAFHGSLAGYDQHLNVVLEPTAAEEGEAQSWPDMADDVRRVEDTTIIRGDNVVTIQP